LSFYYLLQSEVNYFYIVLLRGLDFFHSNVLVHSIEISLFNILRSIIEICLSGILVDSGNIYKCTSP
jgi:hypothetical protein